MGGAAPAKSWPAAGGTFHDIPLLEKIGSSMDNVINVPIAELATMNRTAFLDMLANSSFFGTEFTGMNRTRCVVVMLTNVVGNEPTVEEEEDQVELRGVATVGAMLTGAGPSTSAYYFRV